MSQVPSRPAIDGVKDAAAKNTAKMPPSRQIRAYPKPWYWLLVVLSSLFSALPVTGGIMRLAEINGRKLPTQEAQLLYLGIAAIFLAGFVVFVLRYMVWHLDEFALSRGLFRGLSVPLCDIVFLRIGVPFLPEPDGPGGLMVAWANSLREDALVIGMRDNHLLALELSYLKGGQEIRNAIIGAYVNVTREPYTPEEKKVLARGRMNTLLRVPKPWNW